MKHIYLIALAAASSTAAFGQYNVGASDATKVYTTGPDSSSKYVDVIAYNGSNPGTYNADFSVLQQAALRSAELPNSATLF